MLNPANTYQIYINSKVSMKITGTGKIGYTSIQALTISEKTINAGSFSLIQNSDTPSQNGPMKNQSEKWDLFLESNRYCYFVNIFSMPLDNSSSMFTKFFFKCYICKKF
jgi:hypothetical protein